MSFVAISLSNGHGKPSEVSLALSMRLLNFSNCPSSAVASFLEFLHFGVGVLQRLAIVDVDQWLGQLSHQRCRVARSHRQQTAGSGDFRLSTVVGVLPIGGSER